MAQAVSLRELQIDDAQERYNWMLDEEVTKFLNVPQKYPPYTKEEIESWIMACIRRVNSYKQKAIIIDTKHVGWIDLKNFDYSNHSAELGIAIGDKQYWGKGIGARAIIEMLKYGFKDLNLNKIWLRVDYDHLSAIKCYRKVGFKSEGIMREDRPRDEIYIDRVRMSILKSEMSE